MGIVGFDVFDDVKVMYEVICEEVLCEVEVGILSDVGYCEVVMKLYVEWLVKVRVGGSVREIEDVIGEG